MSIVDVIFSRPEVVLSLAFVVLILLAAVGLALGPGIYRRMKKRAADRKAAKAAAKLAQQKKARRKGKGGKGKAQPRRTRVVEVEEEEADDADAVSDEDEQPAVAASTEAEAPPLPVLPAAPPEPEKPAENELTSDIQDILDSVFVDEEANARYEALMRHIEVSTVEELVALANRVAGELRARDQ